MPTPVAQRPVRYIAEVNHSCEVTLYGEANLDTWNQFLASEDLVACDVQGKASVIISSVKSRWMGARFAELLVAVFVEPHTASRRQPELFLARAFNTSRTLAWMERTFFSTPYESGNIRIVGGTAAQMELQHQNASVLVARQGVSHLPTTFVHDVWEGPIHLPSIIRRGTTSRFVFHARLAGVARARPFDASVDRLELEQLTTIPLVRQLLDSQFEPTEWRVRDDASHARSHTCRRPQE